MVSVYQVHRPASTHARWFSPSSHRCATVAAAPCIRARKWPRTGPGHDDAPHQRAGHRYRYVDEFEISRFGS